MAAAILPGLLGPGSRAESSCLRLRHRKGATWSVGAALAIGLYSLTKPGNVDFLFPPGFAGLRNGRQVDRNGVGLTWNAWSKAAEHGLVGVVGPLVQVENVLHPRDVLIV